MKTFAILTTVLFVFSTQASADVFGIGAAIQYQQGQNVLVVEVQNGSPAEQAGIQVGDQIAAIDGEQTSTMDEKEVLRRMRGGAAHGKIELTIMRSGVAAFGVSGARDFKISRALLSTESALPK
jgi:C-terminal processing protease CtpA/Prc